MKTWTAFVYRADHLGKQLWAANVTDAAEQCINDAGEHIISSGGGYAVYVDSGTLGKGGEREFWPRRLHARGHAEAGKPSSRQK